MREKSDHEKTERHPIPYYSATGELRRISQGGRSRGSSPTKYFFRKLLNIFLFQAAYLCPLNSLRVRFTRWRGVKVGKGVYIGMMCNIDNAYPYEIEIRDYAVLAGNNIVIAHSKPPEYHYGMLPSYTQRIVIGEHVWIGVGVIVLPGTTLSTGCVASAGSVVQGSFEVNSVIRGNPAESILKMREKR